MALLFFDSNFDKILYNDVISKQFISLNSNDKDILFKYLKKVLNTIALIYDFESNIESYKHQLFQNNYQDLKWLATLLIDYHENSKNLKSFTDLYTKKIIDSDINNSLPKYEFSNVQFGRCKRGDKAIEISFNEEYVRDNANLLVSAIIDSSHKLYVNWMDIMPFIINETYFKTHNFYINSDLHFKNKDFKELNFINDIEYTRDNLDHFNSLTVNEIYNVIRNFLYEEIKTIKILIYDIIVDNSITPCINFLRKYFGLIIDKCLNNNNWDELTEEDIINFKANWNKIIESVKNKQDLYILETKENVNTISLERLLKALTITFHNKYSFKKLVLRSKYIPLKKDYDDEETKDEEITYNNLRLDEMLISFESIEPEFLYDYLKDILQEFKYTYYSKLVLTEDKNNIISNLNISNITPKNIYNFAKSFSRYQDGSKYPAYPKNWHSLNTKEKKEILNRINEVGSYSTNPTLWFNIAGYLRYIIPGISSGDIKTVNIQIYEDIRQDLCSLIFNTLQTKGLLSEFIPQKKLTDQSYTIRERELIKKEMLKLNSNSFSISNNIYANNTYSYLTELPYKYSGEILSDNKNIEVGNNTAWFTAYALDWISQISFCHKFINQRVSYVTGGTGIGKSTQVPKLYMYYLKALDYKVNGKVACTQPRKTPTLKNATRVSQELGFKIFKKDDDDIDKTVETDYYYVQMHYKDKRHVRNVPHLVLKYITDGTLLEEIKNLHPLFKQVNLNNSISNNNLYDIVIVDEAHEHNKNMDMILTLMRDYCYFNPEIRLIILSATMDDDEPTYRRYYRDINDNLKYPINTELQDYNIDRINVDRRLHISPPGFGTLFAIKEHYNNVNNNNSKEFAIETIKNIIKKGLLPNRDILVFLPGKADIVDLISELNNITPTNVLAIPFYSEMREEKKSIVEDIDYKYNTIHISKTENFNDVSDITKGSNKYTNFIICATNMAEASITIKRLYYVVETGTRKTNMYSYTRRGNKLVTLNISESSRKQRKGRVGRTGPGEVYYSYKEKNMENNKILFDFATNNMSNDIFNLLLTENSNDDNLITLQNILKDKKIVSQFGYLFTSNYIGNFNHYDYDYTKQYKPNKYNTGYPSNVLYDSDCSFFIIHPEELNIERNIMGKVIKILLDTKDIKLSNYIIQSNKIDSFFEDLQLKKYIIYDRNSDSFIASKTGKLIKELVIKFNEYFDIEDEILANLMIQGIFLNNEKSLSKIVALLVYFSGREEKASNFMASEYLERNTEEKERNIYINNSFRKIFKKLNGGSEPQVLEEFADLLIKQIINQENIFDFSRIDDLITLNKKITKDRINNIMNNFKDDEDTVYDRRDILNDRIKYITQDSKVLSHINQLASILKIKPRVITSFIKSYIKIQDFIINIYNPDKRGKNLSEAINKVKEEYANTISSNYDKITVAFLLSQPFNIVKKIPFKNRYLSVYNPTSDNIFSLPVVKQSKNNKSVYDPYLLVEDYTINNYVLYFNIDMNKDTIHVIINLDKSYFKLFPQIYNFKRLHQISNDKILNIDKYLEKIRNYKDLDKKSLYPAKMTVSNDIDALTHVKKTYNEILLDLQSL